MSQIQQVKEATSIVQIIGERLNVQRSGSSWRALCPFHSEKSPSFFINEQFQRYKCFGCGESGDVFTFLEKYDGMTFAESLKYLAERSGIELTAFTPTIEDDQRERLLAIMDLAKEYYHYLLTQHEMGKPAREYLKQRGVTAESIRLFQLGYALPSWEALITYLHHKKKYSLPDLQAAGLIIPGKNQRYYDRFRDRIMFPLKNHRGHVVGFSGRVLKAEVKEAKYINSPETLLYHKSKMLYGYAELYQEIRKKKEVIVVEGELDVISSTQAHVNNVVAIKGSALTTEHLQLLQRAAGRVLLALDTDSAGVEATKRAITIARETNLELRVIVVPEGKDPDELARHDPKAWRQAAKTSMSTYEFLLEAALKTHDPHTAEGKRRIMMELAPTFSAIPLVVEQDVYIKKLAEALNVKEDLIRTDFQQLSTKGKLVKGRARTSQPEAETKEQSTLPHVSQLEKYILFLLWRSASEDMPRRLEQVLELPGLSPLSLQLLKALQPRVGSGDIQAFVQSLPEDLQQAMFDIYLSPDFMPVLEHSDLEKEWTKAFKELKTFLIRQEVQELTEQLDHLDAEQQNELLLKIVELQRSLK